MRKRKLSEIYADVYAEEGCVFAGPNIESTLMIEAGQGGRNVVKAKGVQENDEIGDMGNVDISSSISTSVQKFMYNRFYWYDDLFTFNYKNGGVGIAIAYLYQKDSDSTPYFSFAIYPVILPRIALSLFQSLSANEFNRDVFILLLKSLAYYLNIGFTALGCNTNVPPYPNYKYGFESNPSSIPPHNYPDYFSSFPWITAQNQKGVSWNGDPAYTKNANNPYFPIFQDEDQEPPLLWFVDECNLKLCLKINPDFPRFISNEDGIRDYIGFQLISLDVKYMDTPEIRIGGTLFEIPIWFYVNHGLHPLPTPMSTTSPFLDDAGWYRRGTFSLGTGSFFDEKNAGFFADVYGYDSSLRNELWRNTVFPGTTVPNVIIDNPIQFRSFCYKFKLLNNYSSMASPQVLTTNFITSLLPTRYILVKSNVLSYTQQVPPLSNSPRISPDTLGVYFISLQPNTKRLWNDATISGSAISNQDPAFSSTFRKSALSDTKIISLDLRRSIQTIDLTMEDEWGDLIQNFSKIKNVLDPSSEANATMKNTVDEGFYKYFEWFSTVPNQIPIPNWLKPLNPLLPISGAPAGYESIFINENWYTSVIQFLGRFKSDAPSKYFNGDDDFNPQMDTSSSVLHFARILGY